MPELKDLLEQKSRRVAAAPGGFDRLVRRRARRERNRRIGAGVLALLVAAAVLAALVRANQFEGQPEGPVHSPKPSEVSLPPMAIAGMPAKGARPTETTTESSKETLALYYDGPDGAGNEMEMRVFTDGLFIWQRWSSGDGPSQPLVIPQGLNTIRSGYVWQRLTPDGVARLRSAVASSGLYSKAFLRHAGYWIWGQSERDFLREDPPHTPPTATEIAEFHALATLLGDPGSWLPASDWADRQIHAWVPACYGVESERGGADLSKLPAAAQRELGPYMHHGYPSGHIPTDGARILFRALIKGGYPPSTNTAGLIGFNLPAAKRSRHLFDPPTFGFIHFSPCVPGP